jgi:hypothetical protein
MRANSYVFRHIVEPGLAHSCAQRLASGNDHDDESSRSTPIGRTTAPHEELPYRVELWDEGKGSIEQVLAVTAHSSIGYAAYYAATREYPDRYVTLRHKNRVINRWNGPEH